VATKTPAAEILESLMGLLPDWWDGDFAPMRPGFASIARAGRAGSWQARIAALNLRPICRRIALIRPLQATLR
jgi:hypothetical protein